MKTVSFNNTYEMAEYLVNDDFADVDWDVICTFEYAAELIEELVRFGKLLIDINICDPSLNGYDDAYVISVVCDEIFCEPVVRDGKHINIEGDVSYIHQDVNSDCLKHISSGMKYMYNIVEYDEEFDEHDCDACNDKCLCGIDGELTLSKNGDDVHGFSYSKSDDNGYHSYSFYSTDELKIEDIHKMITNIF